MPNNDYAFTEKLRKIFRNVCCRSNQNYDCGHIIPGNSDIAFNLVACVECLTFAATQ